MPFKIKSISGDELFIGSSGERLDYSISEVIEFCRKNSCQMPLEFNGHTNWIDVDSDIEFLTKNWFNINVSKSDLIQNKRDKKIGKILD